MKVICYGDSNTYGFDPRSFFGSRYEASWPELLAQQTGWQVINQGENGREIPKSPVSFSEDTDLLILMLGTNDLLLSRTPEATAQRMAQFLTSLGFGRDKILLLAPPPMALGEWVPDATLIRYAQALADCYEALASNLGIRFARIDCGGAMAYDGVHLTPEGHRIFANNLYYYLQNGG